MQAWEEDDDLNLAWDYMRMISVPSCILCSKGRLDHTIGKVSASQPLTEWQVDIGKAYLLMGMFALNAAVP